eukprot:TRINITY_DN5895_c0_g1_i2.p1 TRINITY_DN5895_c0_g1~~TRINITY_DN5895_c0_g1_i2.p1  ORF type:complete len:242 (-),score=62.70 TRINITY_DN5895_c0_g1_i2:796-1521(-)
MWAEKEKETDQWGDFQRRLGNFAALDDDDDDNQPTNLDYSLHAEKTATDKIRETKTVEELDEMEDDYNDDDDDKFMARLREKRIQELRARAQKEIFGEVRHITEQEYKMQVEEAKIWVIVHLYKDGLPQCKLVNQHLRDLAKKFRDVKFLKIYADEAIHNYPESNLPTLLIYHDGEMVNQLIGAKALGGESALLEDLEWKLKAIGAVNSSLEEDPRKARESNSYGTALRDRMNFIGQRYAS